MEQTTVTQESKGFYKLNWLQRIGFGSGDLAQNLIYQTICMYLLFFYTDIYGLNPGVAATMFLVVRLVDVLWDPLVGTYVDKHNPRWGKYRSYLVLAGLPKRCESRNSNNHSFLWKCKSYMQGNSKSFYN